MVIDTCHKPIQLSFATCAQEPAFMYPQVRSALAAADGGVAASMRQNPSKSLLMVQKDNLAQLNFGVLLQSPHTFQKEWSWQCTTKWRTATTTRPLFVFPIHIQSKAMNHHKGHVRLPSSLDMDMVKVPNKAHVGLLPRLRTRTSWEWLWSGEYYHPIF